MWEKAIPVEQFTIFNRYTPTHVGKGLTIFYWFYPGQDYSHSRGKKHTQKITDMQQMGTLPLAWEKAPEENLSCLY